MVKAPYDKEGEKVVTRGGGRDGNDRIMGICMLVGAALELTYASASGNLYAVAYGVGIGPIVGLTLYYFGGRS